MKKNDLIPKKTNDSAKLNPRDNRDNDVLIEGMGNDLLSAKPGNYNLDRADEEDAIWGCNYGI